MICHQYSDTFESKMGALLIIKSGNRYNWGKLGKLGPMIHLDRETRLTE